MQNTLSFYLTTLVTIGICGISDWGYEKWKDFTSLQKLKILAEKEQLNFQRKNIKEGKQDIFGQIKDTDYKTGTGND